MSDNDYSDNREFVDRFAAWMHEVGDMPGGDDARAYYGWLVASLHLFGEIVEMRGRESGGDAILRALAEVKEGSTPLRGRMAVPQAPRLDAERRRLIGHDARASLDAPRRPDGRHRRCTR